VKGTIRIDRGDPLPLGAHECLDGFNLAVFSRHATRVTLLLFGSADADDQTARIDLNPARHRTGDIWHVGIKGGLGGMSYAFEVDGPDEPSARHRFGAGWGLLDPYASLISRLSADPNGDFGRAVIPDHAFDWQDDVPPNRPWSKTVIYETHVRGLTIHPSAGVRHPGLYRGVIEKIPYFQDLGITALELMPVQAFDPSGRTRDAAGARLPNYWGYDPIALFAPAPDYSSGAAADAPLKDFKTMVRALHKAGIEVILDVVFNHTAEGGEGGPTYSFRGLDNAIYYMLAPGGRYLDFTGCGNTLNCNHPVVRSMIIDCLRHWVMHMRVDGFRFDLASVLGRDQNGALLSNPPLLEQIAEDPLLRNVKLIAEAWDSAGAFQVGRFPGARWAEWNCHFRDDVRRFWRGDPGMTGAFATRLCGSADLYGDEEGAGPVKSINFVTCHDGLTLNDLVSFAAKHNEANGEGNRDGSDANNSENNGVEGSTDDPAIEAVRGRQVKNMLATLLLSRGVPMLLGGDEFRRTQAGNNNAYCQDNEISWYDWRLLDRHADLHRFVRTMIAFRQTHPVLGRDAFYRKSDAIWFGADGGEPGWNAAENRLGCILSDGDDAVCLLFNASREFCRFVIPPSAKRVWKVVADSADRQAAPKPRRYAQGDDVMLPPRSLVLMDASS
jgi:glycogen operon protein